ncbi:MAG: hypothetical protein CMP91_07435 [Gammaproteobacteria bacterium]|nr:hypothetical protein [Gammaproteobacteria bacterium]|tara:strand:+ start:392109 stop:392666 length:558 start_codon:yes stop_codon:yes gene_type:complete
MTYPTERVINQTTDDWLAEYESGKRVVSISKNIGDVPDKPVFIYKSHRTTKTGVILSFENTKTFQEVVVHFNADVKYQRGSNKGSYRKLGQNGVFLPLPRSKFRKFWMELIGQEPSRWSAVHKELKARLKGKQFTGETVTKYKSTGEPYIAINGLPKLEQDRNKIGTIQKQNWNRFMEQRFLEAS